MSGLEMVLIVVGIVLGLLVLVLLLSRVRAKRRRRVLTHDQEARQAFFRSVSEKDNDEK